MYNIFCVAVVVISKNIWRLKLINIIVLSVPHYLVHQYVSELLVHHGRMGVVQFHNL
jgi:hypothetical protein